MVIFYVVKLFASTAWVGSNKLIIESDSKLALSWLKESSFRPWNLWKTFNEMDGLCNVIGDTSFHHIFWKANSMADALARFGVDRDEMFYARW